MFLANAAVVPDQGGPIVPEKSTRCSGKRAVHWRGGIPDHDESVLRSASRNRATGFASDASR